MAGSVVTEHGHSCPAACGILVSQPEIEPVSPATRRQILDHWTTRKVLHSLVLYLFFPFFNDFVYLVSNFLAVLSLHCITRAFSSCGEQGLRFVAVCGLLIAVASLVVEHRL